MICRLSEHIDELDSMKSYPDELYYIGKTSLLKRPKVSIVGTRRPLYYTKHFTQTLAKALASRGVCIVSGAAMGVDTVAHIGAGISNTIAVVANSLDIRYPATNRRIIESIEQQGLIISQFAPTFRATPWSFVVRNEIVVALGDVLVVTEADINSGSMRSVEFALKMGKKIFVLPHRLDESLGTNQLLQKGLAEAIYDIEAFVGRYGVVPKGNGINRDEFFYFCQTQPTFDEAIAKFGSRVYEAELEGIISVNNGLVQLV